MAESKREFTRRSDRIEELLNRLQSGGDPASRAVAQELLQAVIELHGVALERILDAVKELSDGKTALAQIAKDEIVSNVLSLHGIHPVAIEARVTEALEKARPYLRSHGGDVELVSVENGTVHVQLQGPCGSCSSSSDTLKSAVESAIYDRAPEIDMVIPQAVPRASHPELVVLDTNGSHV